MPGIAVPAVQLLMSSLTSQFLTISSLVMCGACWLSLLPPLREDVRSSSLCGRGARGHDRQEENDLELQQLQPQGSDELLVEGAPPHYWADCAVAAMIFFAIGGGDAIAFYLETYVDASPALAASCNKELLLLFFFAFATVGDVLGIVGQAGLTDRALSLHTGGLFLVGAGGLLLVVLRPASPAALWLGVCVFGLTNAPSISYSFNLANRLSRPSATSTAVIMLGLSLGVSLVPYLTSLIWRRLDWPLALMCVGCCCATLPVLLLVVAPSCSYLKTQRSFITLF